MIERRLAPARRIVATLTFFAQMAIVRVVFRVTVKAFMLCVPVLFVFQMTVCALGLLVFSF